MPRCAVILADLYPALAVEEPLGVAGVVRMPALEYLLARSTLSRQSPTRIPGWYAWLANQWGATRAAGAPGALVADSMGIDAPAWLVTPLHYQASLDTVRLHPAGLLSLSMAEQQELAGDFARVFADSDWRLHATGEREMLLTGTGESDVDVHPGGVDPARLLGGSLVTGQPQGEGATVLRRLSSEIELWLHDHPVNRRRRESAFAVSGLWPWGGGRRTTRRLPAAAISGELHGGDLFSVSLGRQCGITLAQGAESLMLPAGPGSDVFMVASVQGRDLLRTVQDLESQWLQPAVRAWRSGVYSVVNLVSDDRVWTLARIDRWRFWRRKRLWTEDLLRC